MHNWLITTETKKPEYYKGMLIHADTGVHDQAIVLFQQYVPIGSAVLDVGAGDGAFSKRLVDSGYSVKAIDKDINKWIPKEIPFIELNIELGIHSAVNNLFDTICCLEVIEHVENPWSLLREIHTLLNPGGKLILSTPNITSFLSRLIFLRTGKFHQFDETDLSYGHINPITTFELLTIAHKIGWRVLEIRPGGYLPIFDYTAVSFKTFIPLLIINILRGLVYLSAKSQKTGWCLFFVMEKP